MFQGLSHNPPFSDRASHLLVTIAKRTAHLSLQIFVLSFHGGKVYISHYIYSSKN